MDEEMRQLLSETIEALEAVLIAMQVDPAAEPTPGYTLREAVRRVNKARRSLRGLTPETGPQADA